jgi:hypothetical protein
MSSGTTRYKYETDNGNVFYARTDNDSELAAIRGDAPTTAALENITFEFSKNSREVGCKPRHCILTLVQTQVGTENTDTGAACLLPPGQTTKRVIILKPDTNPPQGTEIPVNGRRWIVGSVIGEQMR